MKYNSKKINIIFIILLWISQLAICNNSNNKPIYDVTDYTFYYKSYHYEFNYNDLIEIPNNQILINNKNTLIKTINSSILSYLIDDSIPFNFFDDNTYNEILYKYSQHNPSLSLSNRRLIDTKYFTNLEQVTSYSNNYAAGSWRLLLRLRDINNGYFNAQIKQTGQENIANKFANTYSIIGNIKNPEQWKDPKDGKYSFKLIYKNMDGKRVKLIWKQSTWPSTSSTISGYEALVVPNQNGAPCTEFKGLGKSDNSGSTYLDGNGQGGCWWNSVGTITPHRGGIPAFNQQIAKSQSLYIFRPPNSARQKHFEKITSTTSRTNHIERGILIGDKELKDFESAKILCEYHYGGMVSIDDNTINNDVLTLCKELGGNCWIGLQAQSNPKTWNDVKTWVNGKPYNFKNWSPGEPNNVRQNEKCTEIWTSGKWNDIPCNNKKHAICDKVDTTKYEPNLVAVNKQMTFSNAIQWCRANFGKQAGLAMAKSFDENSNIRKACENTGSGQGLQEIKCWIGLQQDPTQEFKKWNDIENSQVVFNQWLDGYPKKESGYDCATMLILNNKGIAGWSNQLCDDKAYFICRKGSKQITETHLETLKEEQQKNMEYMKGEQQKGFEDIKKQQEEHGKRLENKMAGMHEQHMKHLDKRMGEHKQVFNKHMSGMKEELLGEMRDSFNKNNQQTVLLQKIDDIKHQQTELELQHNMLEARKAQRQELHKQTNVIMQKQLKWEKLREMERQKRMAQRQKMLQQKHEMRLNEHYQLMNGLKGFLTAFKNLYNSDMSAPVAQPKPKMPGMSISGPHGMMKKKMSYVPGMSSSTRGDAKRYETRFTKFAHFNRPPPLVPPIPPLPPGLIPKGGFLHELQTIQGLPSRLQSQSPVSSSNSNMLKELKNLMGGGRRLIYDNDLELQAQFMDISKCKFDIKFGELCMGYDYKNDIISFDIMTIEKKELKLENKNNIIERDMIDMSEINDVFVDNDLVFFDPIKANIGFNIWKYELMDWKYIKNENKYDNIAQYGKFDYFDDYVHHFIIYEYILEDIQCVNDNKTLPFDICLKVNNESDIIYFDNVDIFETFENNKLTLYMKMLEGFELEWRNNDMWDELIDFDNHIKKCVNLAIMKLCVHNQEDNLYVVEVKLQFINQVINS